MILLIDNFDSFTYNLADYVLQTGTDCQVVRNTITLEALKNIDCQGIILSPGPETPQKAGNLMPIVDYFHDKIPLLGICLGHQAIGQYFGASLEKAIKPVHGKISEIICKQDLIFEEIPEKIKVVRYHSLILKTIPEILDITATTHTNEIMAFRHKTLPVWGIQFHPEAVLTEFGFQMIKNWTDFCELTHTIKNPNRSFTDSMI